MVLIGFETLILGQITNICEQLNSLNKIKGLLVLIGIGAMISCNAGAQVFKEGASLATVGYGFPNLAGAWLRLWTVVNPDATKSSLGPIHLKYEYGLTDKLGIGASINFTSSKLINPYTSFVYNSTTGTYSQVEYEEKIKFSSFNALVRLSYHYLGHDKVDFYSGIGIGYNRNSFGFSSTDPSADEDSELETLNGLANIIPVGYEATLGLRYMFTENIGAYMEIGWAKSLMQFGVAARF